MHLISTECWFVNVIKWFSFFIISLLCISCISQVVIQNVVQRPWLSRYLSEWSIYYAPAITISNCTVMEGSWKWEGQHVSLIDLLHAEFLIFHLRRDFQSRDLQRGGWKYSMIGCYWNYLYLRYLESKMSIKWKECFGTKFLAFPVTMYVQVSFAESHFWTHILTPWGHVDFP